jgi:hypothetical protein
MLPADHPDAIAYLKRESEANSAGTIVSEVPDQTATGATSLATPINAGPSKPKSKPPPRRKPRQSLEAMSAALDKGKKMTTLEKVSPVEYDSVPVAHACIVPDGLEESHGWRQVHQR